MSSLRALKRKSLQKHKSKQNKETISGSWPCISEKRSCRLIRSKSESDISSTKPSKKDLNLKLHAKSERNLQSLYTNFTTSTPQCTYMSTASSPLSNAFSVINDSDQIKIPIIGYEVMEERSRFTVSGPWSVPATQITISFHLDIQAANWKLRTGQFLACLTTLHWLHTSPR